MNININNSAPQDPALHFHEVCEYMNPHERKTDEAFVIGINTPVGIKVIVSSRAASTVPQIHLADEDNVFTFFIDEDILHDMNVFASQSRLLRAYKKQPYLIVVQNATSCSLGYMLAESHLAAEIPQVNGAAKACVLWLEPLLLTAFNSLTELGQKTCVWLGDPANGEFMAAVDHQLREAR